MTFQEQVGFPFLQGLPAVIRALAGARLLRRAHRAGSIAPLPRAERPRGDAAGDALRGGARRHGLTPPKSALARHAGRGRARSRRSIGFPVALKIVSRADQPQDRGRRRAAQSQFGRGRSSAPAQALAATVAKAAPGAQIDGFLVQEMVDGVEIILGARTDPLYGPMLVVGAGGILVELIKDVAFRLLPVGRAGRARDDRRAQGRKAARRLSRQARRPTSMRWSRPSAGCPTSISTIAIS